MATRGKASPRIPVMAGRSPGHPRTQTAPWPCLARPHHGRRAWVAGTSPAMTEVVGDPAARRVTQASEHHHRADALAGVHQVEGLVDVAPAAGCG